MFRKYLSITVLVSFCLKVYSKISPVCIKEVIDELTQYESIAKLYTSSIINPIYGYLFQASGALNNIRFFGPSMETEKKDNFRNYSLDSSNDDIVKLAIELFPSPTGTICHIRNMKDNFGYIFKNNIEEGILFLCNMFVKVLENNDEYDHGYEHEAFQKVREILLKGNISLFDNTNSQIIKLMMIHSFAINVFDDKNDLKRYITIISDSITNIDILELFSLNINVTDEVLKVENNYKEFPYSKWNQPPSNSVISIYDRKTDSFNGDKFFSDCADVLLLNLCNCLFYDPEKLCYSTEKLEKGSRIYNFYQSHNKLFTITDDVRNEWSRVIQGLDNFSTVDNSKYKLNKIVYVAKKRNEVEVGMLNMMNILIKICNVNHDEFWRDFDGENIFGKIEELLSIISSTTMNITVKGIKFYELDIKHRMEVFGGFEIIFENSRKKITMAVCHTVNHAEISLAQYENNVNDNLIDIAVDTENLCGFIFYNYVAIATDIEMQNFNLMIFDIIYFLGPIKTNEEKLEILLMILDTITKPDDEGFSEILLGIYRSILDTIDLTDIGTREIFLTSLVYNEDLTDTEILENWKKSLTMRYYDIYKLWEARILNISRSSIIMKCYNIPSERIVDAFTILSRLSHLETLYLVGIDKNIAGEIADGLGKLNQLSTLDISNNHLDPETMKYFAEAIGKLTNLNYLNISNNNLGCDGSKYISQALFKLENLISFDASFCKIGSDGIEFISASFPYLRNLKHLKMPYNELYSVGARKLSINLESLQSLSTVNLSYNEFGEYGVREIEFELIKLNSLKYFDLSNNIHSTLN